MDKKPFLRAIIDKAVQETRDQSSGSLKKIIFAIALFIMVAVSRYYILGRSSAINFILETFVDSIVVGGMFLVVFFIINLLRAPRLLYYDKQKELNELKEKWESFPLPSKLIVTTLDDKPNRGKMRSGIKIYNPTNHKVSEVKVSLDILWRRVKQHVISVNSEISQSNRHFII